QQRLRLLDPLVGLAEDIDRPILGERRRPDPQANSGIVQRAPRKFFARILLARRRHVRMGEHAIGRDTVAREDAATYPDHGRDLTLGKIRITVIMTRIGNFDPDRARVDVGVRAPRRLPGVPRAPRFWHTLNDVAVFHHYVVRGDFARR